MINSLRVRDYLDHILGAIERIDRYTSRLDQAAFLSSELVQDAVLRNITIIGEASNHIQRADAAFAACHDDIPWQVMYTMRNRISHAYAQVDLEIVWKTIRFDLPSLRVQVMAARATLHPMDPEAGVRGPV